MSKKAADQVVTPPKMLAASVAAVKSYWTSERMSHAKPLPLPTVYLTQKMKTRIKAARAQSLSAKQSVAPMISEPVPPDSSTVAQAAILDTRLVSDISKYPYASVCKLFMRFGVKDYVGSAWTIGESAVFTAGHCVHSKSEGWATNILVHSAYSNGSFSGSWVLSDFAALNGWVEEEDFEQDMAVGITPTPIRPTTGKAGYIANVDNIQGNITSIGYPAEPLSNFNFNGQNMWKSVGAYLGRGTDAGDDDIMSMNNNMTGGCSGGPGFCERTGQMYAIWVNSFRFTSEPNILRSPYFGSGFSHLLEWMAANGGDSP